MKVKRLMALTQQRPSVPDLYSIRTWLYNVGLLNGAVCCRRVFVWVVLLLISVLLRV